jgi:hypothetical protein
MTSKSRQYDKDLVQVTKLPWKGISVDRRQGIYSYETQRFYEVLDRNFRTKSPFIIVVRDSDADEEGREDSKGVLVQMMISPIGVPRRVAAAGFLSIKFLRPNLRSLRNGAFTNLTFRRPLIWGGRRNVDLDDIRSLPKWFIANYGKCIKMRREMNSAKDFDLFSNRKQSPESNNEFVPVVFMPKWDESEMVRYYMINRVFASYCKYTYVSSDDLEEDRLRVREFPAGLKRELRAIRPSQLNKILLSSRPGRQTAGESIVSKLSMKYLTFAAHIRKHLQIRLLREAPWL